MSSLRLIGSPCGVLGLTMYLLPQLVTVHGVGLRAWGPVKNPGSLSLRQGTLITVKVSSRMLYPKWGLEHPYWDSSRDFGFSNRADCIVFWRFFQWNKKWRKKWICFGVWRQVSCCVAQAVLGRAGLLFQPPLNAGITGLYQHTLLKTVQNWLNVVMSIPLWKVLFLFNVFSVCI